MDLQHQSDGHGNPVTSSFDNQYFLLNFIMGMYLGPDVTLDNPRRSAFQRVAEDSVPYTSSDLGSSYISTALLENLYYHLLRKAHPSLRLKPNMLRKYLKGTEDGWQFTSFFPLDLHEQIWYPASFRIVKGIVLIDDPDMSCREEKDLAKLKSLSRIDTFKIELNELLLYEHEYQDHNNSEKNCMNGKEMIVEGRTNRDDYSSTRSQHQLKRRRDCGLLPISAFPRAVTIENHCSRGGDFQRTCILEGPAIMSIRSLPDVEKCNSEPDVAKCKSELDASIVISGTARRGNSGPPVGVVDVGVSKVAYYFRVALPGVKKDYCKFSCEIESDGKVHVRGLTSGGKSIKKPSRIFEMKFQQLCQPGPFKLCFSLPGPVDPRLFAPNFRSDGIFEGVIIKRTKT
ncbi:Increased DNA methylation [Parasponia andersonii]|uniref:Increased DNA methylation n=1 Tax=Parasponia andersonii TaxID=3476 RepID=A0A2P5A965_PARAD|nr:Increased DNA methylation [Parasponia andersonii]